MHQAEDTFILRENKCINYEGPFILELYQAVSKMGDTPLRDVHDDFIVYPR